MLRAARGCEAVKGMEGIALIFGGQGWAEENCTLTKASLEKLAANAYPGTVFLHVRVWMPKMAQRAAAEDAHAVPGQPGKCLHNPYRRSQWKSFGAENVTCSI